MQHPPAHPDSSRAAAAQPHGEDTPFPPRYRWLKRILLTATAIVLLVPAMRCWWSYEAQRRLDAKIAEIRARGEPLLPEDFPPSPSIPDEDNAVYYLTEAVWESRQAWDVLLIDTDAASANIAEVLEAAQLSVEKNEQALRLARAARARHGVDWDIDLSAGLYNAREPAMFQRLEVAFSDPASSAFAFGSFLADVASYHHYVGDDVEAVECLRDALYYAEVVETAPTPLGLLAAEYTIDGMWRAVSRVAPNLHVADERGDPSGAARRADVSALIAGLLDEGLRQRHLWSMWLRRARSLEYWCGESWYANAPGPVLERILLRPATLLDIVRLLEEYESAISMFDEPLASHVGVPAVKEPPRECKLLADLRQQVTNEPEARLLVRFCQSAPGNEPCIWTIAWRRIMATRLALRLYEIDHGVNPTLLADLMPEYLPAVPIDPYFADGRELALLCEDEHWSLTAGHEDGSWVGKDPWPCKMWLTPH